jgi:predicted transcriptional regulator of viral defense system
MRVRDIVALGISREYIRKLHEKGLIEKVERGIYRMPHSPLTEHHTLVEASLKIPDGVICLVSALQFHDLTTQLPYKVWIAIRNDTRKPKTNNIPVKIFRFSENTLNAGVEEHIIEGVKVKIFNPAKTIADCFKFRNKIGLDIAIEALKDCIRKKQSSFDEIWKYAEICRVANIIKPYLQALS